MYIVGREARAVEDRSGLGVAVDTLFAKDGDRRPDAARNVRCGDVVLGIKAQIDRQTGVVRVGLCGELFIRALRIIAQTPHTPRRLGPGAAQVDPGLVELYGADLHLHPHVARRRAEIKSGFGKAVFRQDLREPRLIDGHDLHDDAELLREELRGRRTGRRRQCHVQSTATGKGHLEQRGKQATVGAVVIGKQQIRGAQFRQRRREAQQPLRIIEIRGYIT